MSWENTYFLEKKYYVIANILERREKILFHRNFIYFREKVLLQGKNTYHREKVLFQIWLKNIEFKIICWFCNYVFDFYEY